MQKEGIAFVNNEPRNPNPIRLLGAIITAQYDAVVGILDGVDRTLNPRPVQPSIEWMRRGDPITHVAHQAVEAQTRLQLEPQI